MATMMLFAIGIDEVREIFGATPQLASRLRAISSAQQPSSGQPQHRPGAGRRRGKASHREPGDSVLSPTELDELIAGHYIEPGRLVAAWQTVAIWLTALAWDHARLDAGPDELSAWDFQLAVAGLSSQYSLAQLGGRDAQIPLRPAPGMHVGYVRGHHVLASWSRIEACLPALDEQTRAAIGSLTELLGRFGQWAGTARAQGRPEPDLFTLELRIDSGQPRLAGEPRRW